MMAVDFTCFYVPQKCETLFKDVPLKSLTFENHGEKLDLQVPILSPDIVQQVIGTLKAQQEQYLQHLKTNEIIDTIDEAVQCWLNPRYEYRQIAEQFLPIITGYDHEMIRLFIGSYLRQFRKEKLQRMLESDFPNPLILDEFRPRAAGGMYRAYGPEVITHIFSGNVPALPLWSLASGLLLKSATLGKVSSSEPLFPVLFAKTLREISPEFAESLAILSWKGGDEELERTAFLKSDAVIAYGGKQTIDAVKQKVPSHVQFQAHGHKVSFGVIAKECLTTTKGWQAAKLAAHDVSWFDQQGCLSPHVFFVERGGKLDPKEFAQMLANELDNFQMTHQRAALTEEERHAIAKERTAIELESYGTDRLKLLQSENSTAWTVVYRDNQSQLQTPFPFSPLNRFITVLTVDSVKDVKKYIDGLKGYVQTVGVGCAPQQFSSIISLLGSCGVNRISALGSMPHPEPGWHHDGKLHLADLVRFCDVESSLEKQMDTFDPYRD